MSVTTKTINPYIQLMDSPEILALGPTYHDFTKDETYKVTMHLDTQGIWMEPLYSVLKVQDPIRLRFDNLAGITELCLFNFRLTRHVTPYDTWTTEVPAPVEPKSLGFHLDVIPTSEVVEFDVPNDIRSMIEALLPVDDKAFCWVRFDVLARMDGEWVLADPRLGWKR